MTIFGAYVLAPDCAIAWADSEQFDQSGRSLGMTSKLFVNPAGFAFAMVGLAAVALKGATVVTRAATMQEALRELPLVLRRAAEQAVVSSRQPDRYGGLWAALIGWDHEARAMHAYRLAAGECFVPMLDYEQTVPRPPGGLRPDGPAYLRLIADRQIDELRADGLTVSGGPLHVAVIRPDGITCQRLCDLAETVQISPTPVPLEEPAHVH